MTEEHFDRLAAAKSICAKFIFFPLATHKDEALRYTQWCRARGIRTKVHTGGVSRSGLSQMCGYDILSWLKPDIAAHISGGPIPMSDGDLDRVIDNTSFAIEICSSGNYGSTKRAVDRMRAKGQLARLTLGTDTPGGTGVIPRGMLRNICYIASVCGVPPAEAVAIATGNTAKAHGLDVGILAPGRPADLIVCGPVEGSAGTSIADAIGHGDLPGIAYVIADGEIVVSGRSRQTPPPKRKLFFSCCDVHGGTFARVRTAFAHADCPGFTRSSWPVPGRGRGMTRNVNASKAAACPAPRARQDGVTAKAAHARGQRHDWRRAKPSPALDRPNPSSAKISSLCWPSVGGARVDARAAMRELEGRERHAERALHAVAAWRGGG